MGLHAGVLRAEQLFGALDGDVLHHIDALTAAVIAFAREAFGIFVGQDGAHRHHDGLGDDVLGSDQLDVAFLTGIFRLDCLADLGIMLGDKLHNFIDHSKALLKF